MKKILLTITGVVLFLVFMFYLYVNAYCRYESIRVRSPYGLRKFAQWFIPFDKFFLHFVDEEINLNSKGVKVFKYNNPYIGRYGVKMFFNTFSDDLHYRPDTKSNYLFKGNLKIDLLAGPKIIMSKSFQNQHLYNTSRMSPYKGGFSFFGYTVPRDIPPDVEVTCRVQILEPDSYLQNNYGPVRFYIEKESDL